MTVTPSDSITPAGGLYPGLYRKALVASLITLASDVALTLLPLIIPPPKPAGYAPYAFVYNVTYRFPLLALTGLALLAALVLGLRYLYKTRGNGDPKRIMKLLLLLLILLLPLAEISYFLLFIIAILGRQPP